MLHRVQYDTETWFSFPYAHLWTIIVGEPVFDFLLLRSVLYAIIIASLSPC